MNHVLQMYLKQNPDKDRACYSHFTTATGFQVLYFLITLLARHAKNYAP